MTVCPMMPFLQMDRHHALLFFHYEAVCFSLQILTRFPVGLWTLYGPFIPPDKCWFFLVTFQWEGSSGSKETSDLLMSLPSWKTESSSAGQQMVCSLFMVAKLPTSVSQLKSLIRLDEFIPLYLFQFMSYLYLCAQENDIIFEKNQGTCELGLMLHCLVISGRSALLAMWSS